VTFGRKKCWRDPHTIHSQHLSLFPSHWHMDPDRLSYCLLFFRCMHGEEIGEPPVESMAVPTWTRASLRWRRRGPGQAHWRSKLQTSDPGTGGRCSSGGTWGGMGPLNTGYNRQYSNAVAASLQRKSSSSSIQLGGRFCSAIFRFAYVAVQSSKPTHARQRGCGDEVESRRRNRCQRGHDSRRLGRDYEVQLWRATTMMDRGSQASRVVPFLLMFLLHLKPLLALFPKFISTIKHMSNKWKNEHQWNLNKTYHFCKLFVFVYYSCIINYYIVITSYCMHAKYEMN
jgi:hypothetical protein